MCEALLRRSFSKRLHALEHVFLLCRGFSVFWAGRFLTSSCPIVIFSSDKFSFGSSWPLFFHLCLLSLSVLSSKKRLHICLALLGLGNPCKTYEHQSVGKRWNEVLFLCRQSGWHMYIRARSRSWPFWRADRISACIMTGAQKPQDFILPSHDWKCLNFFDRRVRLRSQWHAGLDRYKSTRTLLLLPWPKKRTILEIRGEKNAVPRVISCSIRRDQRRAKVADSRGSDLPCADRAWSSMISHVEQRSSRRESRWWFFFLARVVVPRRFECTTSSSVGRLGTPPCARRLFPVRSLSLALARRPGYDWRAGIKSAFMLQSGLSRSTAI